MLILLLLRVVIVYQCTSYVVPRWTWACTTAPAMAVSMLLLIVIIVGETAPPLCMATWWRLPTELQHRMAEVDAVAG